MFVLPWRGLEKGAWTQQILHGPLLSGLDIRHEGLYVRDFCLFFLAFAEEI